MPTDVVIQDHNIGTDASLTFQFGSGQVIPAENLAHVMSFSAKRIQKTTEKIPISNKGLPLRRSIPQGWQVTMKFLRYNGNLTEVFGTLDDNYYASGLPTRFALSVAVRNPDGTLNSYLFKECAFEDFDFGMFEGNDGVEQEVSFKAQKMERPKKQ